MESFSAALLTLVTELQRDYINEGEASRAWWSRALEKIIALTGSEYGFIGTVGTDEQGPLLRTYAITDISWDEATRRFYEENQAAGMVFRNLNTLFGRVLAEGRTLVTNDVEHDARAGGRPPGHPPLRTFLGLACGDGPNSMVGLANRPGGYDAALVEGLAPWAAFVGSVVQQHERQAPLRRSMAELSAVLTTTKDVLIAIDARGTIVDASAGIVQLLGFDPAECVGHNVSILMPSPDREAHDGYLERYHRTGERRILGAPRVVRALRRDGSLVWVELFVAETSQNEEQRFVGLLRDVTSRVENEQRLERVAAQLSSALEMAKSGHWEYDVALDQFTFNDAFYKLFGATAEGMGGYVLSAEQYASRFVHPEELAVVRDEIGRALAATSATYSTELEHRFLYVDGRVGYLAVRLSIERAKDGRVVKLYGVNQDVTDRRRQEAARARMEEQEKTNLALEEKLRELDQLQIVSALTSECVGLIQRSTSLSEGLELVSRYMPRMYSGANVDVFVRVDGSDDLINHNSCHRFGSSVPAETIEINQCWALRMGRTYASAVGNAQLLCSHFNNEVGDYALCGPLMSLERLVALVTVTLPPVEPTSIANDARDYSSVSEEALRRARRIARWSGHFETSIQSISGALSSIALRESLQRLALVDELTGLPNRRSFSASGARALARARRKETSLAVAIFDLDHFKMINDTYGHDEGDQVLQRVARVALSSFRTEDLLGRHGGEEFVVLMSDLTKENAFNRLDAFRRAVSQSRYGVVATVTVSIGFVTATPTDSTTLDELLREADGAMYEAKRRGRNQVVCFENSSTSAGA